MHTNRVEAFYMTERRRLVSMMNKWFDQGLTYELFLATETEEMREKAIRRRDTLVVATDLKEEIAALKPVKILVFTQLSCKDSIIVLPFIEKMHQLNPNVEYSILTKEGNEEAIQEFIGRKDIKVPTLVSFNEDGNKMSVMEEYPDKFKKRLKGLDEEDTEELKVRYRRGYYNTEVLQGILELVRY